jgi:aryl-phospho-beta-D-glucosidase BglC (GH1 family)
MFTITQWLKRAWKSLGSGPQPRKVQLRHSVLIEQLEPITLLTAYQIVGGGNWQIAGDVVTGSTPYTGVVSLATITDGTASERITTTAINGTQTWDVSRPVFHFQSLSNYYVVVPMTNHVLELAKVQDGVYISQLASVDTSIDPMLPHTYTETTTGGLIKISVDGVQLINYNDLHPILSGAAGIINDASAGRMESFSLVPAVNNPPAPTITTPASATVASSGKTAALAVVAQSTSGNRLTYTWSVASGPAPVTFLTNGNSSATTTTATFTASGNYTFRVTAADSNGISVQSTVGATVSQVSATVSVSPGSAAVSSKATQQFATQVRDQFGVLMATAPAITWSVSNGSGSINTAGLYTAPDGTGSATVKATAAGGAFGTASITISASQAPPIITTPPAATLSNTGKTATLTVFAASNVGGSLVYTWSTANTPPAPVSFSTNNNSSASTTTASFTATGTYSFVVTITDKNNHSVQGTLQLAVGQIAATVLVTPATATLVTSTTQQFNVQVKDQFGLVVNAPSVTWSVAAGAGTVSSTGLFTAPATVGSSTVKATAGAATGTAVVAIVPGISVIDTAVISPNYLHTVSNQIVDASGTTIRLTGTNLFGFETDLGVPEDLHQVKWTELLTQISQMGFNVVRIPYASNLMDPNAYPRLLNDPANPNTLNGDLKGLTELQVLDKFVNYLGALGMRVILDHHSSKPVPTPPAAYVAPDQRWYIPNDPVYTQVAWQNGLVALATYFKDNPTVVGIDPQNEPYSTDTNKVTWKEWHDAVQPAANAMLAANPNLSIFVEGVNYGADLSGVSSLPVVLNVPNHLVYSAHAYPSASENDIAATHSYNALAARWTGAWGSVYASGNPLWVGEFSRILPPPNGPLQAYQDPLWNQQWLNALMSYMSTVSNPGKVANAQGMSWSQFAYDKYAYPAESLIVDVNGGRMVNTNLLQNLQPYEFALSPPYATTLQFTITLSAPTTSQVTLNYATQDGTAVSGTDYVAQSGTVTFQLRQTTATINVALKPEPYLAAEKTFKLILMSPVNGVLTTNTATGRIRPR